jgi:hypothetical protein
MPDPWSVKLNKNYLPDPQELQEFHDAGAHDIHCPEVVGKAILPPLCPLLTEEGKIFFSKEH